ncbi:desmocollin 2 like isoform X2 [Plectropomus leopardus]|uniref:desmocollin 2 like isoform X2 n=1 Tax=Plectropomus leopardus TaxID=160734 RepID=UPI001C4D5000|nr:desmocollin 2 like isoform X2 [Plectropomus leopardus]
MANVVIFNLFLVVLLSGAESCFVTGSVHEIVPYIMKRGHKIMKVPVTDCEAKSLRFTCEDPSFNVTTGAVLETVKPVWVAAGGRTFSVWAQDNNGPKSEMVVHLVHSAIEKRQPTDILKRFKRRWSPPPFNIMENEKGPFPRDIEKLQSDSQQNRSVYYILSGPGVNHHPVGVFSLNPNTGMLTVHKAVDREEYPKFILTTRVFDKNTHQQTDKPLDITVEVDDENDNAPTFKGPLEFTVAEQSLAGAVVGKVNATDRDKEGTSHVKIRYTLLTGLDLFSINTATGVISTVTNTLDRETKDKYAVTVQIKDMDGAPNGLSNTGTATITVGDINDNPPTFTKVPLTAKVKENEKEKLLLRIPVEDKDLKGTPNWITKFVIMKGNENGNFRIDTDPKTNDGLLYVAKPLNYEQNPKVKLEIQAQNEAPLKGTSDKWLSIPVDINVSDEDEGPEFTAPIVHFTVKENTANGTLIGKYLAVDPETKSSAGIKYYKLTDPANWISVDRNNGDLRVANTIDRESQFVKDGHYNISMKAVDASSKTGLGTVVIKIIDDNDNVPLIPTSELVMCEKGGELGSVLVTAEDNDLYPNSAPFIFSLKDDGTKWSLTRFNDTAATLQQLKELPTGKHDVGMVVSDLQGSSKEQTAKVRICQCRNGACMTKPSSISLGPLGILTLLLPLLLLLLLAALLAIFCVTQRDPVQIIDGDGSGGILLKSNTESRGEEVDASIFKPPSQLVPEQVVKGSVKESMVNATWPGNKSTSTIGGQEVGIYRPGVITTDMQEFYSGQYDSQYGTQNFSGNLVESGFDNRYLTQDSTFLRNWHTNGRYLHQVSQSRMEHKK